MPAESSPSVNHGSAPRLRSIARASLPRGASSWLVLLALGCGDHDEPKGTEMPTSFFALVEHSDWSGVPRVKDPFNVDGAAPPACESAGYRIDGDRGWLEIDTGQCSWVTLSAAARSPLAKGQELRLELSHFELEADEPADARVELAFADCTAYSKTIPVPSEAKLYVERFDSPCTLEAEGRMLLHLHSEVPNTYQLRGLSIRR